jgi:hypothetical protein
MISYPESDGDEYEVGRVGIRDGKLMRTDTSRKARTGLKVRSRSGEYNPRGPKKSRKALGKKKFESVIAVVLALLVVVVAVGQIILLAVCSLPHRRCSLFACQRHRRRSPPVILSGHSHTCLSSRYSKSQSLAPTPPMTTTAIMPRLHRVLSFLRLPNQPMVNPATATVPTDSHCLHHHLQAAAAKCDSLSCAKSLLTLPYQTYLISLIVPPGWITPLLMLATPSRI